MWEALKRFVWTRKTGLEFGWNEYGPEKLEGFGGSFIKTSWDFEVLEHSKIGQNRENRKFEYKTPSNQISLSFASKNSNLGYHWNWGLRISVVCWAISVFSVFDLHWIGKTVMVGSHELFVWIFLTSVLWGVPCNFWMKSSDEWDSFDFANSIRRS